MEGGSTNDFTLQDRGVVVTGAAGGIGREVVRGFAQAGARVLAVDVPASPVEEVVDGLDGAGRHGALKADLTDVSAHDQIFARAERELGRFDVLAHAAAVLRRRQSIYEVTEEDWDTQLDVNLKATFFINRSAAQALVRAGRGGRIVNFSSQAWWTGGFGGSVVYAASKGGVVSLTRGLARTLAEHRITVNAVSPGATDTPMMRSDQTEEQLRAFVDMIPLGRMGEPSEIAAAVIFLASDQASFITGTTLNVSGGQLMY
jgi:NAD(P)-dependent dehydrogenase (short-subunit alcohol dehydrogenase family)